MFTRKNLFLSASMLLAFSATNNTATAQPFYDGYTKDREDLLSEASYTAPDMDNRDRAEAVHDKAGITPAHYTEDRARDRKSMFQDFTGPYFGADIGYNIGSYEITDPGAPSGDLGMDGIEGGLFIGWGGVYKWNWLGGYVGLELGHSWSNADGDFAGNAFEKDHAWLVSMRPGITMYEDALAYGIVGYTRAEFVGNGDDEDVNGYFLGAGSEFSTRSPLKLRLEYTYTNYADEPLSDINFEGHDNMIKLGTVFRF